MKRCRFWGWIIWVGLSTTPVMALQDFDAEYQIVFNQKVVAKAYFRLRLSGPERYSYEAYTVPANNAENGGQNDEILESSVGAIQDNTLVPEVYLYSVKTPVGTQIFEQGFDWSKQQLSLHSGTVTQTATLEAGTQDRLSYLLQLALQVAQGMNEFNFPLAEPEHTDKLTFRAQTREQFELPAGSVDAVGVECFLDADTPNRVIWIAPDWEYIPVLIERTVADGRVRMELLNRRSGPISKP